MKYRENESYRPRVWIDATILEQLGYRNSSGWLDGENMSSPLPLQGLKIKWGARGWYSDTEPASLELDILDPHGNLIDLPAGAPIMVETAGGDNRNLFYGRVTKTAAEYQPTRDNATGAILSSWLIKITAECPLAEYAASREHGSNKQYKSDGKSYLHWWETFPKRLAALNARHNHVKLTAATPATDGWLHTDQAIYGNLDSVNVDFFGFKNDENVSALTVMRQTARAVYPLNRPYFVPEQHTIRYDVGLPTAPPVNVLKQRNSATILDANRFIAGSLKTSSDMRNAINRIGIISRFIDTDSTEYVSVSSNSVQNTVEINTGKHYGTPELYLLPEAQKVLQALYGLYEYPDLTLLPHTAANASAAAAELDEFLRAAPPYKNSAPSTNPAIFAYKTYYLAGSVLNWLKNVEAITITGGELLFTNDEWHITLYPVAVPFDKSNSAVPQLQQLENTQLSAVAENLNVADIEKIRI